MCVLVLFFFSSRRRHTRCSLVTGVQTCALPILADEPTGNLDPTLSAEIMALFASLPEHGTSVLIASHDLGLVKRMKKRVLVLDHGTLVDDISPEDLADE